MKTIRDWSQAFDVNRKPWLLLGKGPSFSQFDPSLADDYFVIGLNHVSRSIPVTLAHFIDVDAFAACRTELLATAGYVVMPWHPHVDFKPSPKTLADYVSEIPELAQLNAEGRLLAYNLTSAGELPALEGAPSVNAKFFSAEAGLNVLAACGVRRVRSLGVDGGTDYAPEFDDLDGQTRLANGHATFDLQFRGIARTLRETGIDYAPLGVEAPARVFVGADETQELPFRVLEYSIKKYASLSVECRRIDNEGIPTPKDPTNHSRTGFSFSRFAIPKLSGYQGRAIYMDADMLVFTDLTDLWTQPFDGASVLYAMHDSADGRVPQYSVLLLDCGALDWDPARIVGLLDGGEMTYEALMHRFELVDESSKRGSIAPEWNSLEHYVPGQTRLLHYTDMPTQPWVSEANANRHLWLATLQEALSDGFLGRDFLTEQIDRGHVSPHLPKWLGLSETGLTEALPSNWTAPYQRFARPEAGAGTAGAGARFWHRLVGHLTGQS